MGTGTATLDILEGRQGSAATTPGSGKMRLYWKTGNPVPYLKDSAGVEYAVLLDSVPAANKVLLDGQNEAWAVIEGTNRYLVFKTANGAKETIVGADPAGVATAKLTLRGGSGGVAMTSTGPIDIDATGSLGLNSSGGPINIGDDAVNQPINIGTQGTRTITHGSATATIVETAASFTWNVKDNVATPWTVKQGANKYLELITTDGSEEMKYGNASTNPKHIFLGTGLAVFGGALTVAGVLTAQSDYNQTGGSFTYNVGNTFTAQATLATLRGVNAAANALLLEATHASGGIDVNYGSAGIDFAGGPFTVNLVDNLGAPFQIKEGANVYVLINTTNNAETITFGIAKVSVLKDLAVDGTVSTKLGLSANPSMNVKGTLYLNDVASANVVNTNVETAFDKAPAQLVANTFSPLRRLKVRASGTVNNTNGGGQQVTIRVRVLLGAGPTTVTLGQMQFNANTNDTWALDYDGHVLNQGAPNTRVFGHLLKNGFGSGALPTSMQAGVSQNIDTTQPITVQVSAQFQNAHPNNSVRMDYIEVELG